MQDGRAMPGSGGPLHLHDAISEASGALAASTHVARRDDRRTPRRRGRQRRAESQKVGERRGREIIVVKSKQGKQGNVVQLARGYTWCMTCLVLRSEMTQQADEAAVAGRLAAASWAVESPVASGALAVSAVGRSSWPGECGGCKGGDDVDRDWARCLCVRPFGLVSNLYVRGHGAAGRARCARRARARVSVPISADQQILCI